MRHQEGQLAEQSRIHGKENLMFHHARIDRNIDEDTRDERTAQEEVQEESSTKTTHFSSCYTTLLQRTKRKRTNPRRNSSVPDAEPPMCQGIPHFSSQTHFKFSSRMNACARRFAQQSRRKKGLRPWRPSSRNCHEERWPHS